MMTLRHLAVLSIGSFALLAAVDARPAAAQPGKLTFQPTWKCRRGGGGACTSAELANQSYRQILVMSTGYTTRDKSAFWTDFDRLVTTMSNYGAAWSTQKRDQILYVGYFTGGGALGTPDAAFDGAILPHPIRDYALQVSQQQVKTKVASIRAAEIPALVPMGVLVLLNDSSASAANAAPPSFIGGSYGIAKMNRAQLASGYIATHELAHAALNFVDEYVEEGFENLSIGTLDAVNPMLRLDGSWSAAIRDVPDLLGTYDIRFSEILANNGNHNLSTSSVPATVVGPYARDWYPYEGGLFFGRGTFHAAGSNLMNSDVVMRASDDGFASAHSTAQQALINTAFGSAPARANDRLRTAGPRNGWKGSDGPQTVVLMFDADKHNQFHRTQHYIVQVGWWERVWDTCWTGLFPIPCSRDVWRVAEKTVSPSPRYILLDTKILFGLASLTQRVLCGVGVSEIPKPDGTTFYLCAQPLSTILFSALPTLRLRVPYQETTVPASQWFTTYYWRFATHNGWMRSGFTGWSSFFRSL
jgi:hypothetical protein